jgi:hypothetical protein
MHNPIPKIFGTEYNDGFKENNDWAPASFRRHVETVNFLGYVPIMVDFSFLILGKDTSSKIKNFFKKFF